MGGVDEVLSVDSDLADAPTSDATTTVDVDTASTASDATTSSPPRSSQYPMKFCIRGRYRRGEVDFVRETLKELGLAEVKVAQVPKGQAPRRPLPMVGEAQSSRRGKALPPTPPSTTPPRVQPECDEDDGEERGADEQPPTTTADAVVPATSVGSAINAAKNNKKARAPLNRLPDVHTVPWRVLWTIRAVEWEFERLGTMQKINYIPGIKELCRKDLLHVNMRRLQLQYPSEFSFWPPGFLLENPSELEAFMSLYQRHAPAEQDELEHNLDSQENKASCGGSTGDDGHEHEHEQAATHTEQPRHEANGNHDGDDDDDDVAPVYIIKKPMQACGRGVYLVNSLEKVVNMVSPGSPCYPLEKHKPLAQRYIANVMLLDGFKFTMRVYVAITSLDPVRAYVFHNGLLRLCSHKYSHSRESYDDIFVHVDSIDINIKNQDEFSIDQSVEREGLRCDILYFLRLLQSRGQDSAKLWADIQDLVAKSILCAEKTITGNVMRVVKQRSHSFDMLGYDILVDEHLKPWLLEINHTPSLAPLTNLENGIKRSMLRDLFQLVDVLSEHKYTLARKVNEIWAVLSRLQGEEHHSQSLVVRGVDLSQWVIQDLWVCIDAELELQRAGHFQRVLPCPAEPSRYLPWMMQNRNCRLAQWLEAGLTSAELLSELQELEQQYAFDYHQDQVSTDCIDADSGIDEVGDDNESLSPATTHE